MITRRKIVAAGGALALVRGRDAGAQQKVWRVGLLTQTATITPGVASSWRGTLLQVLDENGFALGRNLELVDRYPGSEADRQPFADEIAAAQVDVLLAISDPMVRAAIAATRTTPVIMIVGADPVAAGYVASLARPGGRVTGISLRVIEGDTKRLQLLSEAIPGARRFARLNPGGVGTRGADLMSVTASQLGVELLEFYVDGPAAYAAAFTAMKAAGAAGVVISSQPLASDAVRVAESAAEHGLPTMCEWDYMARVGCAFAYGHDLSYAHRRAAEYVVRVLRGAAPAELPVEQSDAWKLTVNLGAARRLGLGVPPALAARADEVIE